MTDTIDQIAEVIGQEAAVTLCKAMGGVSWYIPHKPGPDHQIARIIGQQAWTGLCKAFGGTRLNLPRGDRAWRRQRAVELLKAGKRSVREIALECGTTERNVSRLRARLYNNRQAGLPFVNEVNR